MVIYSLHHEVLEAFHVVIAAVKKLAHEFNDETELIIDLRVVPEALSVQSVSDSIRLKRV